MFVYADKLFGSTPKSVNKSTIGIGIIWDQNSDTIDTYKRDIITFNSKIIHISIVVHFEWDDTNQLQQDCLRILLIAVHAKLNSN